MNRIGIDLGGTKIEGILLNPNGEEISRKRIPTLRNEGYDSILERMVSLIYSLKNNGNTEVSIGVCTPGSISPATGVMKNSNTQCLIGKPLKDDLEDRLNKKISMENDANCFALAEATLGIAQEYNVVFGIILGTGCGAGIVINNNIHLGANHIAGEWGHHVLYPEGRDCYCGNQGCAEAYISGIALEEEWKQLTGEFRQVTDIIDQKLYQAHPEWKENFILNFGRALANVIDILDPDVIVLGGGLSKIDLLYSEGAASAYKKTFSETVVTPILKNKLGDSAGVFGAAMLVEKI